MDLIPKISMNKFFPRMYGLFQTSFYFGYMAVFSTALGIMCGEYKKQNHFSSTEILLLNHKFCYIAKGSDILVMLTQCTLFVFRSGRLHGNKCLCEEDLHKCENRLETQQQCCGSADTSSRSMRAQSLHLFCKKRLWYLVQNLVFHFLNELKVAA